LLTRSAFTSSRLRLDRCKPHPHDSAVLWGRPVLRLQLLGECNVSCYIPAC
jgi:hypothetical protein